MIIGWKRDVKIGEWDENESRRFDDDALTRYKIDRWKMDFWSRDEVDGEEEEEGRLGEEQPQWNPALREMESATKPR
jgi:hypothetical protein